MLGQELGPGGRYKRLEAGPDGAVRSAVLGLEVCEVGGRLRFRDRQGRYLRSHTEAEQAAQRAERARHEIEAEVDRLRALLASATGERAPSTGDL